MDTWGEDLGGSSPAVPIGPDQNIKCDRYYTTKNGSHHFIYGGYEGIPENLLINVIVWLLLLILFSFLRKIAWDYGRIALVSRTEARWTSLFYGDHNINDLRVSQESLDTLVHRADKGFCTWIVAFFKIKDEHILQKSGRDAVQYLTFQRYLMVYMTIVTVLCIGVVLPVNFHGDLEGTTQTFGHTTISNLGSSSPLLWVHAVLAVLFLVIAIVFMRHFSVNLRYEEDEQATRTLLISNIPTEKCYKNLLMQHFQEAYPEAPVQDIQFAYNISKLVKLDKSHQNAMEGLINSETIQKQTNKRPMMIPYRCGTMCCCCDSCCKAVDAVDYYTEESARYKEKCDKEKVNAFRDALGISFVTFEDDNVAAKVHNDFKVSCKGAHNPVPSSVSRELNAHNWEVRYAPAPDNIYWENLSISPAVWWMKAICVNIFLFVLLFFLTTPSMILNLLNEGNYQKALSELHNPLIVQFVPTLLLWLISSLLPNLVYYVDYYIVGHWTRTAEHHAVMRKTFLFLVLMVLVLPSLGLTSAKAFLDWAAEGNEGDYKFRWQCIFVPNNGAFFVNYVITSAFIGSAAELVRVPELLLYAIKLACARSAAERTSVRKSVVWEFQFGCQYAWMLCVFSVMIAFSIPCPLIAPFGLVYLLMKHLVDRYNIYFAYGPSKIDANIHASAINFVIISVILLQCSVLFFTVLRADIKISEITIFSIVALFVTLIVFFGRMCFGWFRGISPIRYKYYRLLNLYQHLPPMGAEEDSEAVPVVPAGADLKPFIPNVLLEDHLEAPDQELPNNAPSAVQQSYGSVEQQDSHPSEGLIKPGGESFAP